MACTIDRDLEMEDLNRKMFQDQEGEKQNLINAFGFLKHLNCSQK